ncbi:MAG: TIGR03943 family protein [Caldilinea sp.]|nr:TIGR03943 family protein [Caldilinea sp.]MDW8439670.1 TIGR03943 family protein [Caldilineaceae bacterium]
MLSRPRFQNALKALALLALAVFLYTRLAGGVLFFYINQRFVAYTIFAIVGLVMVALSYRPTSRQDKADDALHSHYRLGWAGLAIVMAPIALGLLVPPQPLGAAAMQNREINVASQTRSALPAAVRAAAQKGAAERNLLDWLHAFSTSPNPAQEFAGQPVDVIGFVYHDERLGENEMLVNRFVVSCCVADASAVSMIVRWPDAASLPNDAWVQVKGVLQPGEFNGRALPIVVAQEVIPTALPNQPYLYP